uniref:Uncharacterized protein n=1 Tax=Cacopsylla melanoneura TaxID=428564 RepID=A0A8D9EBE0_9HEMI
MKLKCFHEVWARSLAFLMNMHIILLSCLKVRVDLHFRLGKTNYPRCHQSQCKGSSTSRTLSRFEKDELLYPDCMMLFPWKCEQNGKWAIILHVSKFNIRIWKNVL